MPHSKPQILINVYGGLAQDVFSSVSADVFVVDWDTEGATPEDGVLDVAFDDDESATAFVSEFASASLDYGEQKPVHRAVQTYLTENQ
ncbi:MAG: hypothetical protein KDB27_21760 [Planctomycetales bacterium]|nr:hypothetical protein [Planctomycetales bacterium]